MAKKTVPCGLKPKKTRKKKKLDPSDEQLEEIWKSNRGRKGRYFGKRKQMTHSESEINDSKRRELTDENDMNEKREATKNKHGSSGKIGKASSTPRAQIKQREHETKKEAEAKNIGPVKQNF